MSRRVRKGKACPTELGRGNMNWGLVESGKVRLAINAIFVKGGLGKQTLGKYTIRRTDIVGKPL